MACRFDQDFNMTMTTRGLNRRSLVAATGAATLMVRTTSAQDATPAVSCSAPASPAATTVPETVDIPPFEIPADATVVKFGFLPISIYSPAFVAYEKGYYAEQGLDVQVTPTNSGTDLTVAVATNELNFALTGVGPAFWNAINTGLPLTLVAPGHQEGDPVATPLMIAKKACDQGLFTSVADLAGKRVSVNAPGATEYWLNQALQTGGLTIGDIDLQYLAFPDALTALDSGALDGAMIGEPLATAAEQQGTAVRLASHFDVEGVQVTAVFGNEQWLAENGDAATGLMTGYIRACRDLMTAPNDPLNLAIINKYTNVDIPTIAASVKPVYQENGDFNVDSLTELQQFFIERDLMDFDSPIDPESVIDTTFVDAAVKALGND